MNSAATQAPLQAGDYEPPFDTGKLDRLMEEAGIDLLLATSKHNIQYLLGGHRSDFFHFMDALGSSRYLPIFIYAKGRPDTAAYIGHQLERHQRQVSPFWTLVSSVGPSGVEDALREAIAYIRKAGLPVGRIGVETAFLPMNAARILADAFPEATFHDALFPLERLRAIKTLREIALLRTASQKVIDSIMATVAAITQGMTKEDIIQQLRMEEVRRGLTFEYCFLSMGSSLNRAPSAQALKKGDILSIDSGGNDKGYIGDLARMAILGEPDDELVGLLDEVEAVQQAAFAVIRPGATGDNIYRVAEDRLRASPIAPDAHFLAHGMGLISHEAPRLTGHGPIPYEGYDADRPLEAGMVISVETTLAHPKRGLIKLEDSLVVTEDGYALLGEGGRGWNRVGA
ncbi:proline dipeptidase [Sinorhizobium meliloti CCNWSX0020]|uniref:Proline dipeptidase n=1 Tax=Sinorhizobium meliloti CCNWSX0020 TaxID=1107881 RepID=H0G708_RHIML|nr:Xaa-Pro peptidase family protein [Sinorhizobium meliloti]EHK74910.1 proline dipeptidase [Sinorhizobium meliloti CCNWSX0020]